MSHPFIIWAMRRTGGTTLTDLLMDASDRPRLEHEPFNYDRQLGWISKTFAADRDVPGLRTRLREVLAPGPSIKHCYEIADRQFNWTLMLAAQEAGYRHIVLTRGDEVGRLLSLELAKATGAWGKHHAGARYRAIAEGEDEVPPLDIGVMLEHLAHCRAMTAAVEDGFARLGITPLRVAFEDFYVDPEAGREAVRRLLAALDITPRDPVRFAQERDRALLKKGQNTARIYEHVPNIDEARQRLGEAVAAG